MKKLLAFFLISVLLFSFASAEEIPTETVVKMAYTVEMPDVTREGFYTGEVQDNIPHGYGLFVSHNSSGVQWHYVGEWLNGEMSGQGGCYWDIGQSHVGLYAANALVCGDIHAEPSNNHWIDYRPNEHGCYDTIEYFPDGSIMFKGCTYEKTGLYHQGTVFNADGTVVYSGNMKGIKPTLSYAADVINMTYDDLVAMKDQLNHAIWNSEEWQEVEVPQGVWIIGEDIPVGKWTIKAADGLKTSVYWCDRLNESETSMSWNGDVHEYKTIYSKTHHNYEKGDVTEVTWNFKEGHYFIVESGIAIFTPYSGKPSLGFK